jgi:hypothetical protein
MLGQSAAFYASSGALKFARKGTLNMVTGNNVAIRSDFKNQAEPPQ